MTMQPRFATGLYSCAVLLALACGREPTKPVVKTIDKPVDIPVDKPVVSGLTVQLVSPAPEERFRQNDPTIGCPTHEFRGSGFRVAFDWKDVPTATEYQISFWQKNAKFAAITRRVTESEYAETNCNAFVIDSNLNDWIWRVSAVAHVQVPTDSGVAVRDTLLWSEERVYGFKPCRLDGDRPCSAPAGSAPALFPGVRD